MNDNEENENEIEKKKNNENEDFFKDKVNDNHHPNIINGIKLNIFNINFYYF